MQRDNRTLLHTINKLPLRTAQQVPARRPGITAGFSTGKELPQAALSGCNQPQEAFNPISIHQMAPPERGGTHPINRLATYLSTRKHERLSWLS